MSKPKNGSSSANKSSKVVPAAKVVPATIAEMLLGKDDGSVVSNKGSKKIVKFDSIFDRSPSSDKGSKKPVVTAASSDDKSGQETDEEEKFTFNPVLLKDLFKVDKKILASMQS